MQRTVRACILLGGVLVPTLVCVELGYSWEAIAHAEGAVQPAAVSSNLQYAQNLERAPKKARPTSTGVSNTWVEFLDRDACRDYSLRERARVCGGIVDGEAASRCHSRFRSDKISCGKVVKNLEKGYEHPPHTTPCSSHSWPFKGPSLEATKWWDTNCASDARAVRICCTDARVCWEKTGRTCGPQKSPSTCRAGTIWRDHSVTCWGR